MSRDTKANLSAASAYAIASELARPLTSNADSVHSIAQFLSEEQLEWTASRRAGINEQKLVQALNRQLALESAPEYLQFRASELRRIRVALWIEVPELSTGIARKDAKKGSQALGPVLSPFEAYLASGLLIYQKLYNDDYVRTSAEEAQSGTIRLAKKPGLYFDQPTPRRTEFSQRLSNVGTKWSTIDNALKLMNEVLGQEGPFREFCTLRVTRPSTPAHFVRYGCLAGVPAVPGALWFDADPKRSRR